MIGRNLPAARAGFPRTLVVCGIERGGSSMVAAVLHRLGVTIGQDLDATYEDHDLANAIRAFVAAGDEVSLARLKQSIADRDARRETWGFKLPNVFLNPEIFDLLRN